MYSYYVSHSASPNSIEFLDVDAAWDLGGDESSGRPTLQAINAKYGKIYNLNLCAIFSDGEKGIQMVLGQYLFFHLIL